MRRRILSTLRLKSSAAVRADVLLAWAEFALRKRRWRAILSRVAARTELRSRQSLAAVLQTWAAAAASRAAIRKRSGELASARGRARLVGALRSWRALLRLKRAARKAVARARARQCLELLSEAFGGWAHAALFVRRALPADVIAAARRRSGRRALALALYQVRKPDPAFVPSCPAHLARPPFFTQRTDEPIFW